MKLLFDFFPVLVFFGVYKYSGDIIIATAILIPITMLQVAYTWLVRKQVENMHLVTLVLVVALGGATIFLRDPAFIQWKPTLVNWLFAVVFLGSQFIGSRSIVRRMLEANIELPDPVWTRLNLAWVAFFTIIGAVNLYVAYSYSEEIWVNFKLFGMLGLTLVFVILQGVYLARYMQDEDTPAPGNPGDDPRNP